MSSNNELDKLMNQLVQSKVALRRLIEDYQEIVNSRVYESKKPHYTSLILLKNKYALLDTVISEIKMIVDDTVRQEMLK